MAKSTYKYDQTKSAALINLNRIAATEYIQEMISKGFIDGKDDTLMEMFCYHYGAWKAAADVVSNTGVMINTPRGFTQKNPALSIMDNEADVIKKILNEMGLSTRSRKAMGAMDQIGDIGDLLK